MTPGLLLGTFRRTVVALTLDRAATGAAGAAGEVCDGPIP